jgi:Fe-S cluster assembly ATPase SufC
MIRRNGLVIAMTVLLIGAVVSPAQAANKSGGACKTTNAKATIGGKKYTCTKNPIVVNAKNTWVVADCLTSNAAFKKGTAQLNEEKIKRGVFLAQTAATEADQTLSVADRDMLAQTKKDGLNLYDTIINTYNTLNKMNKQVRDLACTPGL